MPATIKAEMFDDRFTKHEVPGPFQQTFIAKVAIINGQFVKVDSELKVDLAVGATDISIGVANMSDDVIAGVEVNIETFGPIRKSVASGTITAGDELIADTGSKAKKGASGNQRIGVAVTDAADGEIVAYVFMHGIVA